MGWHYADTLSLYHICLLTQCTATPQQTLSLRGGGDDVLVRPEKISETEIKTQLYWGNLHPGSSGEADWTKDLLLGSVCSEFLLIAASSSNHQ